MNTANLVARNPVARNLVARNLVAHFLLICRQGILLSLLVGLFCAVPLPALAQTVEWISQWGSSDDDEATGVSFDSLGNVYISGYTDGSQKDIAFVSKYSDLGAFQWTKQLLTTSPFVPDPVINARSYDVSVDDLDNVYVSGWAANYSSANHGVDAFVSKYDASGSIQWTELSAVDGADSSYGVSADGQGNVYVSYFISGQGIGFSPPVFLSKYNDTGTHLWTADDFGLVPTTDDYYSYDVSADGLGNVYIAGSITWPGRQTAFFSKCDDSGALQWTRQLENSGSTGVSADGLGNVYISGYTIGSLDGSNAGGMDAFVGKYDNAGTLLWIRQLGTSSDDCGNGVSVDGLGNVYISGYTEGSLDGSNAGGKDAFVSKYDAAGTFLWTEQFGTVDDDISCGVSADGFGNVFFAGYTYGGLGGPNAGGEDAFVGKICNVPEPTTLIGLLGLWLAGLLVLNHRKQATAREDFKHIVGQ